MNMFRAWTTAAYLGTGMVNLQGCFIDAVTPGSRVGMNFQSPATGRIRNSDISNCGTAVSVFSEYSISGVIFENTVTGTGNTTGISLTKGSKIQIPAATTLTTATSPTGELSIDGVSTTYTVMRAQTPKLVVSDYGSKVYE